MKITIIFEKNPCKIGAVLLFLAASLCMSVPVCSAADNNQPDYETVFSNDTVHEILITITPENWQLMRDNMEELYGPFGTGNRQDGMGNPPEMGNMQNMTKEDFAKMTPPDGFGGPGENEEDPIYVPATVTSEGVTLENVGIRYKGQSSLSSTWSGGSNKTSLKLNFDEFKDEYPETKNQTFYGFETLNLQASWSDSTLMNSVLMTEAFEDMDVVTPKAAFYRVYVNHGEGPEYFGLYSLVEEVDDTVVSTNFTDDSGNIYKPDGSGATFAEGKFNTSAFEKKSNKKEADYSDVEDLYTVLQSDDRIENPEVWRTNLESTFDVQQFLKWLAANTVITNWDTYGSNSRNFYLYNDPSTGKITYIPWDFDMAFSSSGMDGNHGGPDMPDDHGFMSNMTPGMQPPDGQGFGGMNNMSNMTPGMQPPNGQGFGGMNNMGKVMPLNLSIAGDDWPLIGYLAEDPVYWQYYLGYLKEVVTEVFEPEKMEEKYNRYFEMIKPYVTGEYGEQPGYTNIKDTSEFENSVNKLTNHTNERYEAVMDFLKEEGAI